jgi:3-hydroxybutyryl-CoA dehydrogenase
VPDTIGMVTPRIVSMIINEAWYAFDEKISSKEEIDRAMKLGTNYPFGPFEWGEKIGIERIRKLLESLKRTDKRYTIAPGLRRQ